MSVLIVVGKIVGVLAMFVVGTLLRRFIRNSSGF